MPDLSLAEKFILDTISTFYFLTEIGYKRIEVFNHRIEFGVTFIFEEKNRKITIYWSGEPDIHVDFRRQFRKIFPLLVRDIDRRVFVSLNQFYGSEFREINQELTEENFSSVLQKIADFLKKNLMFVVNGSLWFADKSRSE